MALTLSAFLLALDQKRFLISTRQADRNDIMQKQMDYIFITEQMYIAKMMIFYLTEICSRKKRSVAGVPRMII